MPGLFIICIDIFRFPASFCGILLTGGGRGLLPAEMVALASRVPALSLIPVPVIPVPPLSGSLLALPALPGLLLARLP